MIKTMRNICEFIKLNKGYYLLPNDFTDLKEIKATVKKFKYNYLTTYRDIVEIIILEDESATNSTSIPTLISIPIPIPVYKLFFIHSSLYKKVINEINNIINNIKNENIKYIIQDLNMNNFPVIFIKNIINDYTNCKLIYDNDNDNGDEKSMKIVIS